METAGEEARDLAAGAVAEAKVEAQNMMKKEA